MTKHNDRCPYCGKFIGDTNWESHYREWCRPTSSSIVELAHKYPEVFE